MLLSSNHEGCEHQIKALFLHTFTASEGADEGMVIGNLVQNLLEKTAPPDLHVFQATEDDALIGCIIFSRLRFDQDLRTAFLLSPVAVSAKRQREGIGQKLLRHGLAALREKGVDVAVTYGDPKYYSRVGFQQMTTKFAEPPFALSAPEGWLGQSLKGQDFAPLKGRSPCVTALSDPHYW